MAAKNLLTRSLSKLVQHGPVAQTTNEFQKMELPEGADGIEHSRISKFGFVPTSAISRTLARRMSFFLFTPFCVRSSLKQPFRLTTDLFWNVLGPTEDRRALQLKHLFRSYQQVRTATAVAPHRLFFCFAVRTSCNSLLSPHFWRPSHSWFPFKA